MGVASRQRRDGYIDMYNYPWLQVVERWPLIQVALQRRKRTQAKAKSGSDKVEQHRHTNNAKKSQCILV